MICDFGERLITILEDNVEYLHRFLWNAKCIAIYKFQKYHYQSREIFL